MASTNRNTNVVVFFIAALTLGAGVLRWLEPSTSPPNAAGSLLMMERSAPVERVLIELAQSDGVDAATFDCVIEADGRTVLQSQAASLRVLILPAADGRLSEPQARALLGILGNLSQQRGMDLRRVELAAGSDSRLTHGLSAAASDLTDLLVRKGFIR